MSYANWALETYMGGVESLRRKLKKNYSESPFINTAVRAGWAIGYLFGVAFAIALPVTFPFALIEAEDLVQLAGYFAVGAGFLFVGLAWTRARSDRRAQGQTFNLTQTPNAQAAAEAVGYLNHDDTYARQNAMYTVAVATEQGGAGKVVSHTSLPADNIVGGIVTLLFDNNIDTRTHAARALPYYAQEYPSVVAQYGESLREATGYEGEAVAGNIALSLGHVGTADESQTEQCARAIGGIVDDDDPENRKKAATALSMLDTSYSRELLQELANDNRPDVRETAQQGLEGTREQNALHQRSNGNRPASTEEDPRFIRSPPDIDFDDIAGMDDLKQRFRQDIIEPFHTESAAMEVLDVEAETGILLHGPPGTGKTHIAKCLAGELGVNYAEIDVGDLESKYLGEGVENIKKLFEEARTHQPTVVFIDEIDAIAADRDSPSGMHEDTKRMVDQLLQEISSTNEADDDILILAATNRPDGVDDAMLRSGRYGTKIEIPLPDAESRWAIFQHELPEAHAPIPRERFVDETSGFTASDIVDIVDRAGRRAANRSSNQQQPQITEADVFEAIEDIDEEQSRTGNYIESPPNVDFDDIVGMDGLKDELYDRVLDPLKHPEEYEEYGISVERGFVLYGPPGTGKTHIAKCLAGELEVNYIQLSAADIVSKWIGESAQNFAEVFEEARTHQPTVVFIDEIDALAGERSYQQTNSEHQMVTQLLDDISDVMDQDEEVIIIGATNRLDSVDDALLRAGRLGEHIKIPAPDAETRIKLFEAYIEADLGSLEGTWIAKQTEGFVASEVVALAEETARAALRRSREGNEPDHILQDDVETALEKMDRTQQSTDTPPSPDMWD